MTRIYRALLYLVTFAIPVVIAACYGMSYSYRRGGRVLDKQNRQPIAKIDVSCESDGGYVFADSTDSTGTFQIWDNYPCPALQFVDGLPAPDGGTGSADAGASDAGAADAGSTDGGAAVRTERYQTKVIPFGENAGQVTVELDRAP